MSTVLPTDRSPTGPNRDPGRPRPGQAPSGGPAGLLYPHLALAALLAAVLPLAGTGAVWSADEGALLYQATAVVDGHGWTFAHPFPAADPAGVWFPIHLSSFAADGGYLVLGKHTALVWLVGLVHRLGGYPLVLALSATSAVAAASAAARLAGRLDRSAVIPTLWLTGVASPLFLSAYVAWAHTLAAALVGWALVWLIEGDGRAETSATAGGLRSALASAAGAVALAAACLVRTEATLAAAALTTVLAATAIASWRRDQSGRGTGSAAPAATGRAALAAGVGTVAGFGVDRITGRARIGPVRPPGDRWGGLPGRIEAFGHTWLRPDFSSDPEHLLLLVGAAALIGAGIAARRRPADSPIVIGALGLAGLSMALRFALSPTALIPGLLVAFPVLFAGLALLRRRDLTTGPAPALAGFVALFSLAVLATQYRYGGGGEWGGRYFALGLPAAVPLGTVGLVRALRPLEGAGRRRVLGLAAVAVVLPLVMGVLGLRDARERTKAITERVDDSLVEPGDGTGEPVVVTTLAPLGRWAWADLDRARWLLVEEDELPVVGSRLRALGIDRFVFVAEQADAEVDGLAPYYRPKAGNGQPEDSLDGNVIPVEASDS